MATRSIKVDYIARVEGEGALDLTVRDGRQTVARLPVELLTEGAPVRRLESRPGPEPATILSLDHLRREPPDFSRSLRHLMGSPNLGSRRPIFRQYDHMLGAATLVPPGGDAALLRIKGTRRALAMTIDGNGRYCQLDPYVGAQIAVAEAARNLAAVGARPLAVTDCLNFGNPDRPEVYWQLEQAVAGITSACRAFGLPVVSGNVSLYNESEAGGAVYPTPIIGMVGLLEDYTKRLDAAFKEEGDFVLLVGATGNDLGGSEYLKVIFGQVAGRPPAVDLVAEKAVREFMLAAAQAGLLRSAHDCAEGGMLAALAECCLLGNLGVRCPALRTEGDLRLDAGFFGESQGRFVISAGSRAMPELQALARRMHVEFEMLGNVHSDRIVFEGQVDVDLAELRQDWEAALS